MVDISTEYRKSKENILKLRIRSKGLGRIELLFDLAKVDISKGNEEVVITGKTQRPVIWDFKITISEREVPSLFKIALSKPVRTLILSYLWSSLKPKPKQQIAEAKATELVHTEKF